MWGSRSARKGRTDTRVADPGAVNREGRAQTVREIHNSSIDELMWHVSMSVTSIEIRTAEVTSASFSTFDLTFVLGRSASYIIHVKVPVVWSWRCLRDLG